MPILRRCIARAGTFGLLLLGAAAFALPAGAAEVSPRLELKPSLRAVEIGPGESRVVTLTATNRTSAPVTVAFVSIDLVAGDEHSFARPAPRPLIRSALEWLSFEKTPRTLAPGDTLRLSVHIRVPANAAPGAYALAVAASQTFATLAANGADNFGSRVRARTNLGSTLVIVVSGDARAQAAIRSTTLPRFVWGNRTPEFQARVANTGNTLLSLESAVDLSSFGAFATRRLKSREHPTLPGGERVLEMRWTDRPWIGWYRPKLIVVGGTGSGVRVEQRLPIVYVLPPWWVTAALIVALAMPLWTRRRRRRR